MSRRLALAALLFASGCDGGDPALYVDLLTDLVPQVEFAMMRVRVHDEAGTLEHGETLGALPGTAYVQGARVAELATIVRGRHEVIVTLMDAEEREIVSRRVLVDVTGTTSVTVLIARTCIGVTCPGASDDPSATECAGGSCVPPECTMSGDPSCNAECASDDECPDPPAPCSRAACISGICFAAPEPGACGAEVCHPVLGCIGDTSDAGVSDAGTDAGTTGCAGGCDDASPCTDDACVGGACAHTPNGAGCDDGLFCNGADTCSGGTCSMHAGGPCGGGTFCDETARTCTGCLTTGDCPGPMYGTWGACGGFSGTCDENGTESRSVTTYTCSGGTCSGSTSSEMRGCTRSTGGASCGTTSYGAWGACGGFTTTCDESGTQSRSVTTYACSSGTCGSSSGSESQGCMRDTEFMSCGTMVIPCNIYQCRTGSCMLIGDTCGSFEHCCEFGCVPDGQACP